MSNNELDSHLLKCIGLLYNSRQLRHGDAFPLQYLLEEAILYKYGVSKDYTEIFQSWLPLREIDETIATGNIFDDKEDTSVNDLALDLFKEDLMCVVCNKMNIGARNRLVECNECHSLYHQECHRPTISDEDILDTWTCSTCKSLSTAKKVKNLEKEVIPKSSTISKPLSSNSHKHGSSSSHKSSSDKHKSSSSKSSKSGSTSSPSHGSSSRKQYYKSDEKKSVSLIKTSISGSSSSKSSSKYSEKKKYE